MLHKNPEPPSATQKMEAPKFFYNTANYAPNFTASHHRRNLYTTNSSCVWARARARACMCVYMLCHNMGTFIWVECIHLSLIDLLYWNANLENCKIRFLFSVCTMVRSQWPRGLICRSVTTSLLRSWVPISPVAWMSVCCGCCVLSGRGLCDMLITRPEESYWLWCVIVCDLETSRMRRPWSVLGRSTTGGGGIKIK
jgi:hypothetical protein